jgi:predicted phage tail protein
VFTGAGFQKYMSNAHHSGVRFAFFRDGENIGVEEFELTSTASEFTMMPVIEGAKQGGVLQIVIGAVALVAAFFTAGGFLCCMGWRGWMSAAIAGTTTALTGLGISMMLGGVVQMLTPQPKINIGASSSADNKPNYAFGAPVNTVAMGYPVPLLYGQREIGGAVISAGLFSSDQQ